MNLGIITFHRSINYGAVLQAYALRRFIEKNNINVNVIDYVNRKDEEKYRLIQFNSFKDCIKSLLKFYFNRKKKQKFIDFRKEYLSLSETVDKNKIGKLDNIYDCFITGSDQVFNYNITDGDMTYLLDFASKNKKNSYGASFGISKIEKKYEKIYSNLLKDFSYISMREKEGVDLIKQITGKNAQLVLDPTFLLEQSDWNNLVNNYKKKIVNIKKPYILIYSLKYSSSIYKVAEKISRELNCKIIVISTGLSTVKFGDKYKSVLSAGPEDFINLFINARYIITNSFHGTVFSIIFKKNFIVDYLNKLDNPSRIINLLNLLSLTNRILSNERNINLYEFIDYDKVYQVLSKEKNNSIKYINCILKR